MWTGRHESAWRGMTRLGKAVDNRVSLLGAADNNSSLLPAPSVAEAQGSGGGDDRMRVVQEQVDGVKGVMQQNVNQMLENMDRTQHLETTTQELASTAKSFHKTAVKARRHFWLQNLKFKAAVGGALLIGLIIILAASGAFNGSGGDDGDGGGGGGGDGGGGDGRRLLFGA